MLKTGWHLVVTTLLLVLALMLAGCGGGSSGEGALSSAATLGLVVNKTTVASGVDTVDATVTLTSLSSQPVNGVSVTVDMTYNGAVVGSYSGNTNTNGVATITVPVALVPADRTVYLQARSSGITSSTSLAIAVKAPVITVTLTDASVTDFSGVTFGGAKVNFADVSGVGYSGATVTFTFTSSSDSNGYLVHSGTTIINVGDSFTVTTDSYGNALLALSGYMIALPASGTSDSTTFNYTATITHGAYTYTKQGSVTLSITIT